MRAAASGPSGAARATAPRSLVPHEHGAWGQLLLPMAAALLRRWPTPAALALAAAVVLLFVAHEPLLVLTGGRGSRARLADGPRARWWLAILGVAAAVAGGLGAWHAPPAARVALLGPALLAAVAGALAARGREKTVLGEVTIAAALAGAAAPVALAAGAAIPAAVAAWAAWMASFAAATFAVHAILARARSKGTLDPAVRGAAGGLALLAALLLAAQLRILPLAAAIAATPPVALSAGAALGHVRAKRLRELGWSLVGANVLTLLVLVAALR